MARSMKLTFVFLMCILISPVAYSDPGYLIFGDSQSIAVVDGDASQTWPHLIQNYTGIYMQNISRSGRQLSTGDVSAYLESSNIYPNIQIKGIIIALGSNDAFWGAPIEKFQGVLLETINVAKKRRLEVICMLPARSRWELEGYGLPLEEYRQALTQMCPVVWDAADWVSADDMLDGAHYGAWGHYKVAVRAFWKLID